MSGKRKRGTKEVPNSSKKAKSSDGAAATGQSKPSLEPAPFVETPTGDERRREAGLYELLGSEDEKDRIEAAGCIISSLFDGEGVDEPVLQRHLDRRLFRGIASGRNASRLGFSLVITEILSQLFGEKNLSEKKYTGLTFDKIVGFLMDKTQAVGNIPGQEERDHYYGQLFGLTCFVRSQTLFKPSSRWSTVLDLVLKLAHQKVWLRSQCGWVVVQAMEQMNEKQAEATLKKLAEAALARTSEGVAIWLVAVERFPDLRVKPWQHPLASKSLGDLSAVLKESIQNQDAAQGDGQKASKQANWTAQLHFVWDIILAYYTKDSAKTEDFDLFWSRVVDEGFFSKSATDGQKFKGFLVFQKMLAGLVDEPDKLECLFSKNLMSCLMNQAAKKDRFLHRAATKSLNATEAIVASNTTSLPIILKGLLGKNGAYNFDQRTNTKTMDKILRSMDKENTKECLAIIRQPISKLKKPETTEAQSSLRTYVDLLSKSLNAAAGPSDSDNTNTQNVSSQALKELAQLAYAQPADIPSDLLTEAVRNMCRTRLESCFAKLIRQSDDMATFCTAVASIDSTAMAMDESIKSSVDEALTRMNKLLKRKSKSKSESSPPPVAQGLAVLHAVSVLQLYNEDPDAMEVLQDLEQFSERLRKGKLDEEGASELLVEILLSMIVRPSSLMRAVAQQVFEAFTPQITPEGLQLLTDPLASGESTKGQQELFNTEDDNMDVDEDEEDSSDDDENDDSDVEVDSDVEFVDLADKDDDDDDDDESGSDSGSESNNVRIDIDDQLGNILRSHRLDKDMDAESSSSDDEDMTDEQMLAMDEKLSAVLKHSVKTRPDSKHKKDAKQSVVNFKHRILDLVHIYVKKESLNPSSLSLLIPLLNLMRTTSKKDLANRAAEAIRLHQTSLRKARSNKEKMEGISSPEDLLPHLVEVHEEAGKDDAHAYAKAASAASLIIVSSMFAVDKVAIKQIAAVYAKTWSEWVLGESKIQSSFFQDWYNWSQNMASQTA